jgi:hypothetical protein
MLTPEPRGVNITGALAIHGNCRRKRQSAGSIVVDDATLAGEGRLYELLKTLSKFTQWHAVHGDARWEL